MLKNILSGILAIFLMTDHAFSEEVTIGGFAFAGDFKSAVERFPLTFSIYEKLKQQGNPSFSLEIMGRMRPIENPDIQFNVGEKQVNLKSSDRALMAVLMLTGETVSSENFGNYHKTFVNLRGDALIFDYKNQIVVRSYPLSVVLFDATEAAPANDQLAVFVEDLIMRTDGRGLISQFTRRMSAANVSQKAIKTVQVRTSKVEDAALELLPSALRGQRHAAEAVVADGFSSIISAKLGLSLLPRSIGHAVGGVMSLRLENGDDYKLKVGEGDYVFDLTLKKFAKIKTAENNIGTSYVYGAYVDVEFLEPTLGTSYLNTALKNGESAIIPAGQIGGDDFPGYQDAFRGLFLKLADVLADGGDGKWLKTAASAKDIEDQVIATRKILEECK